MNKIDINEKLQKFPIRVNHQVQLNSPNQEVEIWNGRFNLYFKEVSLTINGEIYYSWFPDSGVKFKGEIQNRTSYVKDLFTEQYIVKVDDQKVGSGYLQGVILEEEINVCEGSLNEFWKGNIEIPVEEIRFCLPNMRSFVGEIIRSNSKNKLPYHGRLTFISKPYELYLDQIENYNYLLFELRKKGGYAIFYEGKIFKEGGLISLSEFLNWHNRFHTFLTLLNGRIVAPLFYSGFKNNKNLWSHYTDYYKSQFRDVNSWSEGLDFKDINNLWMEFDNLWQDENDRDFISTLTHWYVEANSKAGKIEGAIILIQTALELLFNWLIIEKNKEITRSKTRKMNAIEKLEKLIDKLQIDTKIPENLDNLKKFNDNGPMAIVNIRNALVHGDKKGRTTLNRISEEVMDEVLQLGIWYVELSFLKIFKYSGRYYNRTSGRKNEMIPWKDI
ncbi:hypothetical protein [Sphingobacterium zeae]|uniref:YopA central domain-containing protein n=1 Tax=Sphingobacterium zeae TaxID=1776859 RepID=A0ABU0U6B5_9SPHI|nr:hypothetical protein [Sphingobacterium zeae]MDQ1150488.1 hypothetical protein [Sphingobacterium zeae]